ncbi:MAG: hypothetical protein R3D51_17735 [Hyphomicrobiaceae bacterium]
MRFTATAATAATIAAMDGPLPVGDIIGGGLLIYDAVTTVYGYIFNSDAPDFVGTSSGELIPVPEGADGPYPADNNKGIKYINGSGGGNGLHDNVTGVRIMDPTNPSLSSPGYPGGYVSYGNGKGGSWGQTVDPNTGKPVGKGSGWHIPLQTP